MRRERYRRESGVRNIFGISCYFRACAELIESESVSESGRAV